MSNDGGMWWRGHFIGVPSLLIVMVGGVGAFHETTRFVEAFSVAMLLLVFMMLDTATDARLRIAHWMMAGTGFDLGRLFRQLGVPHAMSTWSDEDFQKHGIAMADARDKVTFRNYLQFLLGFEAVAGLLWSWFSR